MTLYRDMSGESLHKRGYRDAMHRATLNESAAAGALMLAGWPERAQQGWWCELHACVHVSCVWCGVCVHVSCVYMCRVCGVACTQCSGNPHVL